VRTLRAAYGDAAFKVVPRTFKLPEQLDAWSDWVGGSRPGPPWRTRSVEREGPWALSLAARRGAWAAQRCSASGWCGRRPGLLGRSGCPQLSGAWRLAPAQVKAHPAEDSGLWMLKNNKQRGTGLRLVRDCRRRRRLRPGRPRAAPPSPGG
jgi:hypothetical protein